MTRARLIVLCSLLPGGCVEEHPDWAGLAVSATAASSASASGGTTAGETSASATESTGSSGAAGTTGSATTTASTTTAGTTTAATTGELPCDTGECVELSSSLFTEDFQSEFNALDRSNQLPGRILLLLPGDVESLTLSLTSNHPNDGMDVELRDGAEVLASCAAGGNEVCDLGTVDTSAHNNRALLIEATDAGNGDFNAGLRIDVSAVTRGVFVPMKVSSSFQAANDSASWVLWPVGPGTGSFTYVWEVDNQERYSAGVLWEGDQVSETNVDDVSVGTWPASGMPEGFYLFGASTFFDVNVGVPWTFGITP